MLARLVQLKKAARPIPVTGLPSMVSGMTSVPEAEVSQSVMVTSPLVVVYVKSLTSAARSGRAIKDKQTNRA